MKHYDIAFMPTAREGLLEIGEYIALDNPTRALSFVDELTSSLKKALSVFPLSYAVAENIEVSQEIRMYSYGNYNTYYRVLEDKSLVEILFIYHANRDIQELINGL